MEDKKNNPRITFSTFIFYLKKCRSRETLKNIKVFALTTWIRNLFIPINTAQIYKVF